jgi:anaerobic ribonucleoside-triphosphate reductase
MSQEEFLEELNNKLAEFVKKKIKEKEKFKNGKIKDIYNINTKIDSEDILKLSLADDFISIIFYIGFRLDLIPDWAGEDGVSSSSSEEFHNWKIEVKKDKQTFLLKNLDTKGVFI